MFYQKMYKYDWMLPIVPDNNIPHTANYYYLPDDMLHLLDGYPNKIIKKYPFTHESLVENLHKTN